MEKSACQLRTNLPNIKFNLPFRIQCMT